MRGWAWPVDAPGGGVELADWGGVCILQQLVGWPRAGDCANLHVHVRSSFGCTSTGKAMVVASHAWCCGGARYQGRHCAVPTPCICCAARSRSTMQDEGAPKLWQGVWTCFQQGTAGCKSAPTPVPGGQQCVTAQFTSVLQQSLQPTHALLGVAPSDCCSTTGYIAA